MTADPMTISGELSGLAILSRRAGGVLRVCDEYVRPAKACVRPR